MFFEWEFATNYAALIYVNLHISQSRGVLINSFMPKQRFKLQISLNYGNILQNMVS